MKFFRFIPVLAVAVCVPVFSVTAADMKTVADGIKAVVADRVITFAEVEDITRVPPPIHCAASTPGSRTSLNRN